MLCKDLKPQKRNSGPSLFNLLVYLRSLWLLTAAWPSMSLRSLSVLSVTFSFSDSIGVIEHSNYLQNYEFFLLHHLLDVQKPVTFSTKASSLLAWKTNLPVSIVVKVTSRHTCSSWFLIKSHVFVQSHWLRCSNNVRLIHLFAVGFCHQVNHCKVKKCIAYSLLLWAHAEGLTLNRSSFFHLCKWGKYPECLTWWYLILTGSLYNSTSKKRRIQNYSLHISPNANLSQGRCISYTLACGSSFVSLLVQ